MSPSTSMPSDLRADRERLHARTFAARPELDGPLLAAWRALPYFREATRDELERSFERYVAGDIDGLLRTWSASAEPTRATMPAALRFAYAHAGKGPRHVNASVFLDSVAASLRAGERFRDRLPAAIQAVVRSEFPYLERRHEHVPVYELARFEFPTLFDAYIVWGDLDDTRARWQLAVAVNEVQQSCYSAYAARLFRLPELERHAARERELAHNYFGHWSPRCTYDLWRETIYVLDALNAATFEFVCSKLLPRAMTPLRVLRAGSSGEHWRQFVANIDTPQWLLPVPPAGAR